MSNSVDPDETAHMSRLIWIYVVCKCLLLVPLAVKELTQKMHALKKSRPFFSNHVCFIEMPISEVYGFHSYLYQ